MSSATMAILTIGVVPLAGVLPLLTEHIREEQITHISLLGDMTHAEVVKAYAVGDGEQGLLTLLTDGQLLMVSREKIERDIRSVIAMLDRQNYDVILLLSSEPLSSFATQHAILLEPQRIIPPLVASIVDGHQVGVIVPVEEIMPMQRQKWLLLEKSPYYALANPFTGSDSELLTAGKALLEQGADVLVLDCLGYYQHHRDVLQKALDVPVLLSNVLVSRLAAELLV
ncbi:AroM family protein [Klebsiella sp. 10982]|nr:MULTISPECIES: AroM family protein [Klebsiella]QBL50799.1 AroM family protein [Klebsiella sp. PO552]ASV21755.1 AroM protein [Klebsiella quasivariicola]MBK2373550.1 AroM family protein [Klebsiella quasivariicola]MBS5207214.1 AroM family protein [Klebsiella sp.]MCJ1827651.1 AroM family protein [Klebsiella quasivariicola]